jgi:ubiquinone/menaquinone biosynthesis C-methylase UbiE
VSREVDPRTRYQDPETAEQYDRQRFHGLAGRLLQWSERRALRRILRAVPPGSWVLDAPCGTGRFLPLYLRAGCRILGVDISEEMIAVARRRLARRQGTICFVRMDLAQIPLRDGCVGTVFSIRFLPHFPSWERIELLRELRRVSQGRVVISLAVSSPWMRCRRKLKGWLHLGTPGGSPVTWDAFRDELKEVGLREAERFWMVSRLSEQVIIVCHKV